MKRLREAPDLLNKEIEEAEQDLTGLAKSLSQLLVAKADKKSVSELKAMAVKMSVSVQGVLSQLRTLAEALKANQSESGNEITAVKAKIDSLTTQIQALGSLQSSVNALSEKITQIENNDDVDTQFSGVAKEANALKDSIKKLEEAVKILNERPQTIMAGGGTSVSGTPAENDYARFDKRRRLEGRTAAQVRSDLDLEAGTDFPSLTTFNDHSTRHEDGGADEISIAGLAGTPAALTTHEAASDPHTGYIKHSLATAENDVLVASGVGAFVKKTLAELKTLLGIAADIATHAALTATHGVAGTIAGLADITTHAALTTGVHGVGAGTVAKTADITDANLVTTDVTTNDASTSKHGFAIKAVAPAANLMNVPGIVNGETVFTNKPIFDATAPSTQALGDAASAGTSVIAAHRDHKHAMPAAATAAEITTGTDTAKPVTADALAGSDYGKRAVGILVNDSTALTGGDGKAYFRIPSIYNGWNLVGVAAHMQAGTAIVTIQINNVTQAADMLSTLLTIDANETDSSTALNAAVIDTNNDDVATGNWIRIDIDGAGTGTTWLYVELTWQLP